MNIKLEEELEYLNSHPEVVADLCKDCHDPNDPELLRRIMEEIAESAKAISK